MKTAIGVVLVVLGVIAGLWAGLWWAFIGGIVDVIEAVRATELDAMDVAIGVVKIFFAGVVGWCAGAIAIIPGWMMLSDTR